MWNKNPKEVIKNLEPIKDNNLPTEGELTKRQPKRQPKRQHPLLYDST
jgi:hypothetical protein